MPLSGCGRRGVFRGAFDLGNLCASVDRFGRFDGGSGFGILCGFRRDCILFYRLRLRLAA